MVQCSIENDFTYTQSGEGSFDNTFENSLCVSNKKDFFVVGDYTAKTFSNLFISIEHCIEREL